MAFLWRHEVQQSDVAAVSRLVAETAMFTQEEIAIAAELVSERIEKGPASGYEFLLAEEAGSLAGYTCYGRTAGTDATYDLYWIVVARPLQGRGLGRELLVRTEALIRSCGGARVYVDTSSTEHYVPTRAFYGRTGYREVARLEDFYRAGDSKVIYEKRL